MSLNSSILPPHIRQATYASDYSNKSKDIVDYKYWTTETYSINSKPCLNIVAPSSGCFQRFRSFQERLSVIAGQRQCTSYCPIYTIIPTLPSIVTVDPIVEPIIKPEYMPPIEANAARITFRTQFTTISQTSSIIQIAGDIAFNLKAYLGKNQEGQYAYIQVSDQQMYTIENTYLNYNNTVYIDILKNQSAVRLLSYRNGGIREIDNINALYNLSELVLDNNQITDVTELKYNINLQTLYLRNNSISDIGPMKSLINIEHLYLSSNQISNISAATGFNQLKTLDINKNNISDLEPIRNKTLMSYLNASYNNISDLSPISLLINLVFLGVDHNKIRSLSPLLSMTKLSIINLANNQIDDANPFLIMLASQTTSNGVLNLTGNNLSGRLTTQGQEAIQTLQGRGWTVTV